jgi:hypothetical protein
MIIRDVCPRCQSDTCKKNGRIHNAKKNHLYRDGGRQFTRSLIERFNNTLRQRVSRLVRSAPCPQQLVPEVRTDGKVWAAEHAKAFPRTSSE